MAQGLEFDSSGAGYTNTTMFKTGHGDVFKQTFDSSTGDASLQLTTKNLAKRSTVAAAVTFDTAGGYGIKETKVQAESVALLSFLPSRINCRFQGV
jgi:hypothetical protein